MWQHVNVVRLGAPALLTLLIATGGNSTPAAQIASAARAQVPRTLRLYVVDCGQLNMTAEAAQRYHVTAAEVGDTRMSVPCFLIAHPKGTMMWDLGVIPDPIVEALARGTPRSNFNVSAVAVVTRTLKSQLAEIGYSPADIMYVAVSHSHNDHSANLNEFAGSTWLARPAEREFMWAENNTRVIPSFYTELKNSKSIVLDKDEHDVFGDGRVVIKSAPGHTPGHQVLILGYSFRVTAPSTWCGVPFASPRAPRSWSTCAAAVARSAQPYLQKRRRRCGSARPRRQRQAEKISDYYD
jgi:glyoxylase-like metal-dependent hydrolase (beta-lactamase superfamily II)